MILLVVGLLLLGAKIAGYEPVAAWSWWVIGAPFAGAVLWWAFADASGLTRRRAMQKMDERKEKRRDRSLEALGLGTRNDRRPGGPRAPVDPGSRRGN